MSHWEGVVETVIGSGFRGRLVPFEDGRPNPARVEFTDFAFADLAAESDRELVAEGAIFYWTIGRGKNAAGSVTNVSLVRFRRLPVPGEFQHRRAREEAQALLRDLDNGTDAATS